jgi:hypothetical protein
MCALSRELIASANVAEAPAELLCAVMTASEFYHLNGADLGRRALVYWRRQYIRGASSGPMVRKP